MSQQMNNVVKNVLKRAAGVAVLGLVAMPAAGGDLHIGINIGVPTPPPPVVVVHEDPVVVTYDTYVVGYRRNVYDADLALRLARADEFQAYDELQAARRHEADVAAALDDTEAMIADLHRRVGDGAADAAALHADVLATADRCTELRKVVAALDHRIASAHEDYEAAKTLNDGRGMDDAQARIRDNESQQAAKAGELHDAEGRLAHLREMEAHAAAFAADRARLADAEARRPALLHEVEVAHDAVYNTEHRWADAHERVIVAMHDRDEALWVLHRDDILAGRIDLATCGFAIDLSVWGGHLPRDPEVIHAYCVRDVAYIRANPVFIETRWADTGRVTELVKIREITRTREVAKIRVVERVESVKIEDRRHYAEAFVTEHKRFEAEEVERRTAVAEHRAPHVTSFIEHKQVERANAQAAVANHNAAVAEKEAAVANHNAAVAEKDAHAEAAKSAEQQKQIDAQSRQLRRDQAEINNLKDQQAKSADAGAAAGDSRSSRARRRAADEASSQAPAGGSKEASAEDSRSSRARRRADDDAQQQQQPSSGGARTAAGAQNNGRTQGRDPQANDR